MSTKCDPQTSFSRASSEIKCDEIKCKALGKNMFWSISVYLHFLQSQRKTINHKVENVGSCETFDAEQAVKEAATILQDTGLLAQIANVDFIAKEVKYRHSCRKAYLITQGPANKYISLPDRRSRREDTFFGAKFSIRFFRYYIKFLNKENMHTYSYGVLLYSDGRMPPLVALFADLYQFCTRYVKSNTGVCSADVLTWRVLRAIINRVL